jgi:hypothetical protein
MRQRPGGAKRSRDWRCGGEERRLGESGGRLQGAPVTEGFELANVVALLAFWADTGVVVAGAEVVELDGLVAQQVPDEDQDATT